MAALTAHARDRAIEYGLNPAVIERVVSDRAPRYGSAAIFIEKRRNCIIDVIVRDGKICTVYKFFRKPTAANHRVDVLIGFPKED